MNSFIEIKTLDGQSVLVGVAHIESVAPTRGGDGTMIYLAGNQGGAQIQADCLYVDFVQTLFQQHRIDKVRSK